jgi:hypothetical protein
MNDIMPWSESIKIILFRDVAYFWTGSNKLAASESMS